MLTSTLLALSIVLASALGILSMFGASLFDQLSEKQIEIREATTNGGETISPSASEGGQVITVGNINNDASKTIKRFQPTADYIAKKLSSDDVIFTGEVVVAKNMAEMIKMLRNNEVDIYYESAFGTVAVNEATGATAELVRWKDGASDYHSIFVVRNDSAIKSRKASFPLYHLS